MWRSSTAGRLSPAMDGEEGEPQTSSRTSVRRFAGRIAQWFGPRRSFAEPSSEGPSSSYASSSDADEAEGDLASDAHARVFDMAQQEKRKWKQLRKNMTLMESDRDGRLRSFCVKACERERTRISPSDAERPVMADLASPCLVEHGGILPGAHEGPPSDEHFALAAAAAAYGGQGDSPAWLPDSMVNVAWLPASTAEVACSADNVIGSGYNGMVSITLFRRGTSLYVASAESSERTWRSWVDSFAAPLADVDACALLYGSAAVPL